jgi:predicted  nucleic acid-binding Zn-ribbon protein
MIDNLAIAICIFVAAVAFTVTYFFTRSYFIVKLYSLEEQLRQKIFSELQIQQSLQKMQIEKEQLSKRTNQAETKLVMANVAIAELREKPKHVNEQLIQGSVN